MLHIMTVKFTPNPESKLTRLVQRWIGLAAIFLVLPACSSYGVVKNSPITTATKDSSPYSLQTWASADRDSDIIFIIAFSGGGSRASAMAYGVLEELRDTQVVIGGKRQRLLDEVDYISSVSGGSFTAAYYGLYGDKIFTNFEDEFLRKDVEGHLAKSVINPFHWFGSKGRTQRAIDYYQRKLFHGATFADMQKPDRPMIIINSSDLARGVRFSFTQEYFNFIGSDLSSFPVADAVAASSAVPVVFNPVVVQNYPSAPTPPFTWPTNAETLAKRDPNFRMLYEGLTSYQDKTSRKYVHLVDGGITDNTGMRAMSDLIRLLGGPQNLVNQTGRKRPRHLVFLSVNASTKSVSTMDESTRQPSILTAMNAAAAVQLHRYNMATLELARSEVRAGAKALSRSGQTVTPHFIELEFEDVPKPEIKLLLNKIPTSLNLTDQQVDTLISSARTLLKKNPEYRNLLKQIR